MISAFLHFQQNLNILFNNFTKILDKFFLKCEEGGGWPPKKNYPKKSLALLGLNQ